MCFMHGDGIGSEQAQRAPHHHIDLLRSRCSLEMEWSKQRTSGMEERKPRSLAASSSRRVNARGYGIPVWPARLAGAARALGGVAAASAVWRAEWRGRRGRGIGEERKEEDGIGIYICHAPLLLVPSPHRE